MKKRCTESKCRKVFSYDKKVGHVVCPFCGREYGKLSLGNEKLICKVAGKVIDFTFLLGKLDTTYSNKLKMMKAVRFGGDFGEMSFGSIPEDQKKLRLSLNQAKQIVAYYFKTGDFPTEVKLPNDGNVKIIRAKKIRKG